MNTIELLNWRYATKKFNPDKKLSTTQLDTLKNAFNLTATSYGLQPITLVVVGDEAKKNELKPKAYNQSQVSDASHLLVFCVHTVMESEFVEEYFQLVKEKRNTADEILTPYKDFLVNHFTTITQDEKLIWAAKQAYLAMGNLLTVCALEQIDACPMEGFDPEGFAEVLQLKDKNLLPVLIMPVGFRANDDMFADFAKVRKDVKDTVIEVL